MTNKTIKLWHFLQTLAQIILFTISCLIYDYDYAYLISIFLLCICEFTLLLPANKRLLKLQHFNYYFEVLAICYTLPHVLNETLYLIQDNNISNLNFYIILAILYSLVMFIPMAKLALNQITNLYGKLLLLPLIFLATVFSPRQITAGLKYTGVLKVILNSEITGALAFIIITYIAMKKANTFFLHFKLSNKMSVAPILVIILAFILKLLSDIMPALLIWPNIIDGFDYYISQINYSMLLTALRAGTAEEWLLRFCILSILISILKNARQQLLWVTLIDGLLFSIFHICNLGSQSLNTTLGQMLSTLSFGIFITAVYLYTNSILIPITFHFLHDLIALVLVNAPVMSPNHLQPWQSLVLEFIIALLIAGFLTSKQRKETIYHNLA
ncbi:CPBP family intramembrane metalloprotease [Lactobacillus sp. ESL0731]|uniref:CPBP family intramembrane glutamic endopeptidase n=1 Tax=unclassified Lactobacillus TaxID=2620435 RepID=UPI0023F81F47|nr:MULTISPECIES: CPBP family intramembrane glutamic endopeptidase [unclassified Lactobacillus]WEV51011.1 CPBP family intramembrane metalloprotease [Lactobacillus sp. ESL0700]WEV62142.1 CPBP family intramembrane metalloprotease [Lactobacillus sp. ESL0731]